MERYKRKKTLCKECLFDCLSIDHQFFQGNIQVVQSQFVHIEFIMQDIVGFCPPAAPVGSFGGIQPYDMRIFFLESAQPFDTGCLVSCTISVPAAFHQFVRVHLGIAYDDDLVFAADVLQNPFCRNGRSGAHTRVFKDFGIDAVVEIEYLQVFEMVGISYGLEQSRTHLAVIIHGAAAVHQQQNFYRISSGFVVNHFQAAGIIAGFTDGTVNVEHK